MKTHSQTWLPIIASALLLGACSQPAQNHAEQFDFQEPAQTQEETTGKEVKEPIVIGHTYIPSIQFAPSYIAKEKDLFPSELNVELRHHGADEGLFTALLAGEENLVIATADEMLQARSNGLDLISVGTYYSKYPVKIIVKEDSTINSISDLKGKTVGLPGEYGSNWFALQAALKEANLSKTDLKIQSIGYTQLAALRTNQVDAVVGFTNNDTVQFNLAGEKVKEIELSAGELPLLSANIVTTSEFAKTHPDELKQVLKALKNGMQKSVDNPQTAVEATKVYDTNLNTPEAEKAALETIKATNLLFAPNGKVDFTQDIEKWQKMADFLGTLDGVLGSKVRIDTAVTNEYL
ncbi:ABC transporter substrate-binding protein [Gleimia coleocanis]|nr:ABC transporter substrate-binding protein [Gleimia coleocanis]